MLKTLSRNTLFYGDNLAILRKHVEDASVDLVYLDPPCNSNATYNVLFKAPDGHQSQAQIEAIESWITLVSVTAYHSFGGEVEALNTPTIRHLTPSCRHQLSCIAPAPLAEA